MSKQSTDADGPLKLPLPANPALRKDAVLVAQRLSGHSTSSRWLPEGLSDELDELRHQHLRYRDQLAAELTARHDLAVKFAAEDAAFKEAEREAFRVGEGPAPDRRTPADERDALFAASDDRIQPGAEVLADLVEEIVDYRRRSETDLLVPLNAAIEASNEKVREAKALLADARDESFRAHRMGAWLIAENDDIGIMGRQPAPVADRAPAVWSAPAGRLGRPYHMVRDWANADRPKAAA